MDPSFQFSGTRTEGLTPVEWAVLKDAHGFLKVPLSDEGKIAGVLILPDGRRFIFVSGKHGGPHGGTQAGFIPRGPGSGVNRYTVTHIEGHSAATLHRVVAETLGRGKMAEAALLLPKAPCGACDPNLPQMLPRGSRLFVVDPESTTVYRSSTGPELEGLKFRRLPQAPPSHRLPKGPPSQPLSQAPPAAPPARAASPTSSSSLRQPQQTPSPTSSSSLRHFPPPARLSPPGARPPSLRNSPSPTPTPPGGTAGPGQAAGAAGVVIYSGQQVANMKYLHAEVQRRLSVDLAKDLDAILDRGQGVVVVVRIAQPAARDSMTAPPASFLGKGVYVHGGSSREEAYADWYRNTVFELHDKEAQALLEATMWIPPRPEWR